MWHEKWSTLVKAKIIDIFKPQKISDDFLRFF